ncbi:hypothetical protein GCM10009662_47250 [Catellatospora coxensis]|uniref:Uncharacterized protein n=1 Tax=Catellatospora coxensis TaxID=310354 RepID=A0A8J3LB36_9ACTN|nr:hypothetical protein Cco03nite_80500 [Catellatospora coxensis]
MLSESEQVFITALRAAADAWRAEPADTWVWRLWDEPPLLIAVSLADPQTRSGLGIFGVHLIDGRMRGDRLHSQLYDLPERPSSVAVDSTGGPSELVGRCASWFEAVLRKPVVRYEWLHEGAVYADRYLFADSGEGLTQRYVRSLAPWGQADRLTAAGHVHGKGWIQTAGLGVPDRFVHVRGDRDQAVIPAGVAEVAVPCSTSGIRYE